MSKKSSLRFPNKRSDDSPNITAIKIVVCSLTVATTQVPDAIYRAASLARTARRCIHRNTRAFTLSVLEGRAVALHSLCGSNIPSTLNSIAPGRASHRGPFFDTVSEATAPRGIDRNVIDGQVSVVTGAAGLGSRMSLLT